MTPETIEYKREASGRFAKGTLPGPGWARGGGSRGKTWKRADGGATLGKRWKTDKSAWNRKEPVVRVCHYPGCEVVITTPPSLARIKACCQQHQYIPKDRRDSPYTADWPVIRVAVWERDGYRCLTCSRQPKRPECHHLDYNKLNNDQANLATQCSGCHQGGHRRNIWPIGLSRRVSQ